MADGDSRAPSKAADAFRSRNFRLYQVARLMVIVGAEAQSVAVAWQVYQITHSALKLGLTGLALFLPGVLSMLAAVLALAWQVAPLHAQSAAELDRLRAALRTMTAQVRALEDQRAAVQAKQTESDREKDRLIQQIEGYKAQVKEAQDAHRQAVEEFNRRLLREAREGRRFIVIVDEAQNLDASVLETIRLLSDFETPRAKLLQIVLAGQPELADKLGRPSRRG